MEIRPATRGDMADVRRVARAAWDEAYDFLPPKEHDAALDERYSSTRLEAEMEAEDEEFLVAIVDESTSDDDTAEEELVGFAHTTAAVTADSVGKGELRSIHVVPDRWNEGVGTALVDAVEGRLGERGFTRLTVPVFAENDRGMRFLESNGFERVEERITDLFTGGTRQQYVYYHQFSE